MQAITRAVEDLPMTPGRPLKMMVVHRYRDAWPYRRLSGMFHMPQQTLRDRMGEAHTLIARALTKEDAY